MKTTLHIQNLKCSGCANTITTRMHELNNINDISINIGENTVTFDYVEREDLIVTAELLSKLGYPIEGYSNSLGKKARSYLSCAIGQFND